MRYAVVFTPEAEEQLIDLYGFIAGKASPEIAERYTDEIVAYCEGLGTLPLRCQAR
jgi:toxin ParE1/3/4